MSVSTTKLDHSQLPPPPNVPTSNPTQVMKIAVAPTVIGLELLMFRRLPGPKIILSVCLVCLGIAVATVTDSQMVRV